MLHVEIPKSQIGRRELTGLAFGASSRRPALLSVPSLLVLSISSTASAILKKAVMCPAAQKEQDFILLQHGFEFFDFKS
jgi:hypothetical protein